MKVLGKRVYIELPKKEESKLIVDSNTKEALNKELLKKMSRLKVFAVGADITEIKVGDEVLIDPSALARSPIVTIDDKEVLLVNYLDIIHVW